MELWDVYDRNRQRTGKVVERGAPISDGEYHITVHMAIFTPDGRMLIQKRTPNKFAWPSMWDISAGGAIVAGESATDGAARELFEELGIRYDFSEIRPHITLGHKLGYGDIYILEMEIDPSSLTLQPTEVEAVRLATLDEILAMMKDGSFIPYHESFVRLLFDMRAGYGAHHL